MKVKTSSSAPLLLPHTTTGGEAGQMLVVFALLLPVMFAMLALLVDGGYLYGQRRSAQNAADAGSLAAAASIGGTGNCPDNSGAAYGQANILAGRNGAPTPSVQYTSVSSLTPPGAAHALPVCKVALATTITSAPFMSGILGRTSLQAGAGATAAVAGVASYGNDPARFAQPLLPVAIDVSSFNAFGFAATVQRFAVTGPLPSSFYWFVPAGGSCADQTVRNDAAGSPPYFTARAGDRLQLCQQERPDAFDALAPQTPVLRTVAIVDSTGGSTAKLLGFANFYVEMVQHGTGIESDIFGYFVNLGTPAPAGSIGSGTTPNYGVYTVGLVQ